MPLLRRVLSRGMARRCRTQPAWAKTILPPVSSPSLSNTRHLHQGGDVIDAAAARRFEHAVQQKFQEIDADEDGVISHNELFSYLQYHNLKRYGIGFEDVDFGQTADELFESYNAIPNSVLDKDEFRSMVLQNR